MEQQLGSLVRAIRICGLPRREVRRDLLFFPQEYGFASLGHLLELLFRGLVQGF